MDSTELEVLVLDGTLVVSLPGTRYSVRYSLDEGKHELRASDYPIDLDTRSIISQAEFMGRAWRMAHEKARELGWI